MAKINRYDGNVEAFASQADTNKRTTFGTETTGDDTLDGNFTSQFFTGWQIVGPNEQPTLEDFNAAFFTIGQLMAYLHQVGMPEWNGAQEYHIGSMVNRAGVMYICTTNNHASVTPPESDATNWRLPAAGDVGYSGGTVAEALDAVDSFQVGAYQSIQTNLTGAQEPDQTRWIKLTAGEDGVGQYNEGKLINETITGSGDTVVITAQIDDIDSPMNGQVINLLNSENRYTAPGESAGAVANDQMQQITGAVGGTLSGPGVAEGAFSELQTANDLQSGTNRVITKFGFDSANSPDARTGTKTDVKRIQITAYIKFKE